MAALRKFINVIRRTHLAIDMVVVKISARSGFLSSIYYAFFSREFFREHKSVLQGRIEYWESLNSIGESCALLRRNIHRLEKGLIMRPRKDIFAEDYILETVLCFKDACNSEQLCTDEKRWASDVLLRYFSVVGESDHIQKARRVYNEADKLEPGEVNYIPYKHSDLPEPVVSTAQLAVLFKRRRSVRWFEDRPVSDELLKQAVDLAATAPSACNRQPYKFYIANQKEKAVALAKAAMGTTGYADNLPCMIAIVGDLSAYPYERDRHVVYIDGSLAAMQLMLAFETLGLSTCAINWPDVEFRERLLDEMLQLKPEQRVIMLLAVGYADADGGIPFSQKKNANSLVRVV